MAKSVRDCIAESMEILGLNYAFLEWKDDPAYPYFVGEYQEAEPMTEDGMQETSFLLTGFTRSVYADLEEAKDRIKKYFNPVTGKMFNGDGFSIAVFYAGALGNLPTGDAELKKIQVNLTVKEWRVF